MNFRRATPDDCILLAELNHQLLHDEGYRKRNMFIPELEQRLRGWLASEYAAVIFEKDGEGVAYAMYREQLEEIYLRQLFVVRNRRRQGIGRKAVEILRTKIWPASKRLTVDVLVQNTAAIAFWRAVGYKDYCLALEILPEKNCNMSNTSKQLIAVAHELCAQVERLKFSAPVTHVYNPLDYAWAAHEKYLQKFGGGKKSVVFIGMNPGPFGMVQTGVPFGEVAAVRDWMRISAPIGKSAQYNPKRPVLGFDCPRSEVSGRRFWGLFKERFGLPENLFVDYFVVNYCSLAFCVERGRNLTPDKLRTTEYEKLYELCDNHLLQVLKILEPEWIIGVGNFATERGKIVVEDLKIKAGRILHPAPANPKANRGWAKIATEELIQLGVWK